MQHGLKGDPAMPGHVFVEESPAVFYLIALFLVAAMFFLLVGAFSRSQRRQRRFVMICAALLAPALILGTLSAYLGHTA